MQKMIIFVLDDPNTFYQYAGGIPFFKYSKGYLPDQRDNPCQIDQAIYEANITFSGVQRISHNGNDYDSSLLIFRRPARQVEPKP